MKASVCEICGKPANYFVKDLFTFNNWDLGIKDFSENGDVHSFCHEHKRESETTDITESPLTWFYKKQASNKD